ncbi:MAG: caspase family protein [Spirochaetes bacterium]|nr:caspase family protein [Spirochaetota bacterium]
MRKSVVQKALLCVLSAGFVFLLAALPVQSQTIHAILVGDTVDPNIGRGDKLDLDLMRGLLQETSRLTGASLKMKVFDSSIIRSEIMNAVTGLNPGSDDTVVFFYTGHGYRMSSFRNKWPAMSLKGNYGGSAGLDLKWAYDTLKKKNPRLLIVMADACNSTVPIGSIDTHMSVAYGEGNPAAYRKLFLQDKGGILASSSVPGQYSYSGTTGSQFTVQFMSSIKSELSSSNPTWKGIMTKASQPIMGGRQQPQYAIDSEISSKTDTNPEPYKDEQIFNEDSQQPGKESYGALMVAMESHIPFSAQTSQWKSMRPNWIQRVAQSESSISKMRNELLLFEKHILWDAQKQEWKQQRNGWIGKVQAARTISELADPLVEVEGSMKEGVFISLWARDRPGWMQRLTVISGSSGGSGGGDKYSPSGGDFKRLLMELEEGVSQSAKSCRWNSQRNSWRSRVQGAGNSISDLRQFLIEFESNIQYAAQVGDWPQRRPQWLSRAQSASSMSELRQVLLEAEGSMNSGHMTQSWQGRRNSWNRNVQNLR